MEIVHTIYIIVIVIMSVIIHEVAHGVAADKLGDPTARYAGRLTLNPVPHIDMVGSIIFPILSSFSGFFFGWAKPVPYNPYNFTRMRVWGEALVAAAGPLSNLAIALVFGVLVRLGVTPDLAPIFMTVVAINCSLFLLNLIPVPPLDGSKILSTVLPGFLGTAYERLRGQLEYNPFLGFGIVILIIVLFGKQFSMIVYSLARLIVGV
jgi:Zn-dependent protease